MIDRYSKISPVLVLLRMAIAAKGYIENAIIIGIKTACTGWENCDRFDQD